MLNIIAILFLLTVCAGILLFAGLWGAIKYYVWFKTVNKRGYFYVKTEDDSRGIYFDDSSVELRKENC